MGGCSGGYDNTSHHGLPIGALCPRFQEPLCRDAQDEYGFGQPDSPSLTAKQSVHNDGPEKAPTWA